MNEFSLIEEFFRAPALHRSDVLIGIGDDAACLNVPHGQQVLVSTDTLVAGVHFLSNWDPYDIAIKALMVNISDIAAMGAKPCWLSLALTIPELDKSWLQRFSQGFHDSLKAFDIALIGGDTTKGPLSLTLTILGLQPAGKAIRRSGARVGDLIYLSGDLGAAALAVRFLDEAKIEEGDKSILMNKLKHPKPRVDLADLLLEYASSAIDISDGLTADLNHICQSSGVGACLTAAAIPIHPLVKKYLSNQALTFALSGGDDYELCFTIPSKKEKEFLTALKKSGLLCHPIGSIEEKKGLRMKNEAGELTEVKPLGYRHF